LRGAHLKVAEACVEDINYKAARGLDKRQIASPCQWRVDPTHAEPPYYRGDRVGQDLDRLRPRSQTCRQGASVLYWRVPRLIEELRVAHGDGSYIKF